MDDFNYFKEEQKKIDDASEAYRVEANKQLTGLSKNLILVSTIFIALTSPIIASIIDKTTTTLAKPEKYIFLSGLGLLILSLLSGLIQFIIDVNFYKNWVKELSEVNMQIAGNVFKSIDDYKSYVKDKTCKLSLGSSVVPLIFQGVFLFLGISGFVFFIYRFLI